ncbi:MAG: TonB-dependent receptor plug domain-containing protein [Ekhidna sp.]|nr:TonB-dependent receptor plug domain-containing protein [Ekhidna sp.]
MIVQEYLTKGISVDDKASKIQVDIQDMEILPGLSERDILLTAQILAGIGSTDESAGGLNVRGSSSDNTFLYWNQIPVYQPAHYFGNISAFIPASIGKVDVYKNFVPVKYGGSSSGLLLINSREVNSSRPILESNLNLTHGDIYTSIPFANYRGQISVAARRSFNDLIATPTFNSISNKLFEGSLTEDVQGISDDFEYNSKLIFQDLNLVANFQPNSKDEFSFSALQSKSALDYRSEDDENILQSIQTHDVQTAGANLTWTRRWMDQLSSEWSTSFADYQMDYSLVNNREEDDETENDLQQRTNNMENLESRFTLTYSPKRNHALDIGYQYNFINADLVINENSFFEEDFQESIESTGQVDGIFINYFGKFNSGLQIGLGLRHNRYQELNDSKLDR